MFVVDARLFDKLCFVFVDLVQTGRSVWRSINVQQ